MSDVRLSGPTNSQLFTTCCGLAICEDQERCPGCNVSVWPFDDDMEPDERNQYERHEVRQLRWRRAFG